MTQVTGTSSTTPGQVGSASSVVGSGTSLEQSKGASLSSAQPRLTHVGTRPIVSKSAASTPAAAPSDALETIKRPTRPGADTSATKTQPNNRPLKRSTAQLTRTRLNTPQPASAVPVGPSTASTDTLRPCGRPPPRASRCCGSPLYIVTSATYGG